MIKGLIQEDITANIYAMKTGAPQYINNRQITDIKGEIDSNAINRGAVTPTYINRQIIQTEKQ